MPTKRSHVADNANNSSTSSLSDSISEIDTMFIEMAQEERERKEEPVPPGIEFSDWKKSFRSRLLTDVEGRDSWSFLVSKGCCEATLETLLLRIQLDAEEVPLEEEWMRIETVMERGDPDQMRRDVDTLLDLSFRYEGDIQQTLERASCLLANAANIAQRIELPVSQPLRKYRFLFVLVGYVLAVTKKKNYRHLAAIVRCGCRAKDPKGGYSHDAVRRLINRLRNEHSDSWLQIQKAIKTWRAKSGSSEFFDLPELFY